MAKPRTTYARTVTGGKWDSVFWSLWESAQRRYGRQSASDGTEAPPLTFGELATLVRAWKRAPGGAAAFPLWSQWAAMAYRWDPRKPSTFDTSSKRRDAMVDADTARDFWLALQAVAGSLDDDPSNPPAVYPEPAFDDAVWQAEVRADLVADGARIAWKIPISSCSDPKTGKARPAKLACEPGWTLTQTAPGVFLCVKDDDPSKRKTPKLVCEGDPVTIDDPITVVKRRATSVLLILAVLWFVANQKGARPRRTR